MDSQWYLECALRELAKLKGVVCEGSVTSIGIRQRLDEISRLLNSACAKSDLYRTIAGISGTETEKKGAAND